MESPSVPAASHSPSDAGPAEVAFFVTTNLVVLKLAVQVEVMQDGPQAEQ